MKKWGPISLLVPLGGRGGSSRPSRADTMRFLGIDLDLLTPAERRDLANALLRAAWSAALEPTRILLLDLLLMADESIMGNRAE